MGYADCGNGMIVATEHPNYAIPPMDGSGTQEAIVGRSSGDDDVALRGPGNVKVETLIAARLDLEREAQMEKYLATPIHVVSPM